MIEQKYDTNGLYLYVKTNQIVTLENMLQGLEFIEKNNTLPRDLRIVEDATDVDIMFNLNDIDLLIDKMKNVAKNYNSIKHAVIHNSPKNTVFAMLLSQNNIKNYLIKIFYTKQAACNWIIDD